MVGASLELTEIQETIKNINTFDFDEDVIVNAVKEIIDSSNIKLIDDSSFTQENHSSSEKLNSLRVLNTPIYISLSQIKENLKSSFFQIILCVISGCISKSNTDTIIAIASEVLPKIISCIHRITEEEKCICTLAIDFYLKDKTQFHKATDFNPKLLENYCDNLTFNCAFRRNNKCHVSMNQIYNSLNSLENKHILERNTDTNEYRYIRW